MKEAAQHLAFWCGLASLAIPLVAGLFDRRWHSPALLGMGVVAATTGLLVASL
jgi:hypothetical protein